jgi:pSer/pThr/pTyr-binding forkhead associated (FHA) protein
MNSQNGTYLNGNKVEIVILRPGDVIRIGNTDIAVFAESGAPNETTVMVSEYKSQKPPV